MAIVTVARPTTRPGGRPVTARQSAYIDALVATLDSQLTELAPETVREHSVLQRMVAGENTPRNMVNWHAEDARGASFAIDILKDLIADAHELLRGQRAELADTAPVVATLEAGIYTLAGDVYRVRPSRSTGRLFAEVAVPTGSGARWEYVRGMMARLTVADRMTAEAAAEFGQSHGWCVKCGRLLTDPASIERGIGPVCADSF